MEVIRHNFFFMRGRVRYDLPIIAPPGIHIPSFDYGYWRPKYSGSYCGAGQGFGDKIVPETAWGLYLTLACYVHDYMWDASTYSRHDFEQSNIVFFQNNVTIITKVSRSEVLKHIRLYRAVTMYDAVDSLGWPIFKKLKEEQNVSRNSP